MTTIRRATITGLALGLGAALLAAPAARAAEPTVEEKLFGEKCSLCHSSKRILTMDPAQIKPVVERMRKMNPDWLTTADSDHIVAVIARITGDPAAVAGRQAWKEAVARGEALFKDDTIGANGKACTDCHAAETMKQVADGFPRYDLKLRRIVDLEDVVVLMMTEQLGKAPAANSPELLDLMVYLKSLK